MFRSYFTNKWIIGGFCVLIVFGIACYFWYQHELAPYKQQAAETSEMLRQQQKIERATETQKQGTVSKITETEPASGTISEATETPTDDVQEMEPTELALNTGIEKVIENVRWITVNTPAGIRQFKLPKESPHGFGPFPEIPEDYNAMVVWLQSDYYEKTAEFQRQQELLHRVLIKLWSEGDKNFKGGTISAAGKVYPTYPNTYYINVEKRVHPEGFLVPFLTRVNGREPPPEGIDLLNPPPHITVLDYETAGIDPFEYLNLP